MPTYRHEHVDGVEIAYKSDPKNSISVWLGLTRYQGMLAAVVESNSAKEQVSALLDLIDLHLSGQGTRDGIALLIHEPTQRRPPRSRCCGTVSRWMFPSTS